MIYVYSQLQSGFRWLRQYSGANPSFACILGFTATGLIPGISAAGATPQDREYTAIADAEFLAQGVQANYHHPLPILTAGVSPTFISRAVVEALQIPTYIFNAGLPHQPTVDTIDLRGIPAACITTGRAMHLETVQHLFKQGQKWGEKLANTTDYLIIGECVVGGTTTALALLMALGIESRGMVNSSHPSCNHTQKWSVVQTGLLQADLLTSQPNDLHDPLKLVAAIGDPMQIVAAGMAITASKHMGVLLAGGTQMLAVYALIEALINYHHVSAQLSQIVVGTTRWVAEDTTGNTVGLAKRIGRVPLLATRLSFATSRYTNFRAYSQGYVKEGVGAGGCAIAAHLKLNWTSTRLLTVIETLFARYRHLRMNSIGQ
ncbi:nicotinate mononucleotide-dependent phosphoribosyltransferase CobT [Pleurocapsa sp. PCC 7319]|uniref:nicotinate mononucleotide-dependent phosphoribosyltransferase CobT n=1 Tax=Pleurocapsa sp. PCC 7319 TaxID=118161 RepID=UPI0003489805|nr:TIGR00303 family protein [Pleurocapsa sp. PCC 7319]